MLDSTWNHDELALLDPLVPVEEVHPEATFDHQKHFVFVLVVMEGKLAFSFHQLDLLAVQIGSDVGLVVLRDFGELFVDIDFLHGRTPPGARTCVVAECTEFDDGENAGVSVSEKAGIWTTDGQVLPGVAT
jgi:hypothetical protein